jgi:Uma2 family endonuclease
LPEDWDEIVENIVTEDDEPVDSLITERQMRLLTRTLYSSWQPPPDEDQPQQPRKFFAAANVGVFSSVNTPPIVPDVFLSLDVEPKADWTKNKNRAYFIWEFDKPPDVALEIVSNKSGGELSAKLKRYAQLAVKYYVVFDPLLQLSQDALRVYELSMVFAGHWRYRLRDDYTLPGVGLGLTFWRGAFEESTERDWLRWCDADGQLIPLGEERAQAETERANAAEARAAWLEKKLREMGVETP